MFVLLARPERFELPTPWFVARYSIQLSYGRYSGDGRPGKPSATRGEDYPSAVQAVSRNVRVGMHLRSQATETCSGAMSGGIGQSSASAVARSNSASEGKTFPS